MAQKHEKFSVLLMIQKQAKSKWNIIFFHE